MARGKVDREEVSLVERLRNKKNECIMHVKRGRGLVFNIFQCGGDAEQNKTQKANGFERNSFLFFFFFSPSLERV